MLKITRKKLAQKSPLMAFSRYNVRKKIENLILNLVSLMKKSYLAYFHAQLAQKAISKFIYVDVCSHLIYRVAVQCLNTALPFLFATIPQNQFFSKFNISEGHLDKKSSICCVKTCKNWKNMYPFFSLASREYVLLRVCVCAQVSAASNSCCVAEQCVRPCHYFSPCSNFLHSTY